MCVHVCAFVFHLAVGPPPPPILNPTPPSTPPITDKHLEAVGAVLAKLRSPRLQSLLMIQASPAYLDRVVAGLRQKLEHMAKMRGAQAQAAARREEAIEELVRSRLLFMCVYVVDWLVGWWIARFVV